VVSFPEPNVARSDSNFVIYRTNDEGLTTLHIVGTLEDTLVHHEGRWRIKDRLAILESYSCDDAIVVMP
jgi:hypothetical protein